MSKKNILKRWESMSMADKLIKLKPLILMIPEIELKKIQVRNDLTEFFEILWQLAQEAKDKHQIYSFWISRNGLRIKRTPTSEIDVIWSKSDLVRCIHKK